ncbi:hypothetical protein ANO11243_030730 [Dothideomycetidae sp. 11243]|nr:hypothetical protein ANO11243_030730 [fungal sp. No.11243]
MTVIDAGLSGRQAELDGGLACLTGRLSAVGGPRRQGPRARAAAARFQAVLNLVYRACLPTGHPAPSITSSTSSTASIASNFSQLNSCGAARQCIDDTAVTASYDHEMAPGSAHAPATELQDRFVRTTADPSVDR